MGNEADYSGKQCVSFAKWDHAGSYWKTYQPCLLQGEEWKEFSDRLPASGTMRNGQLFQHRKWVRRTNATASLSSRGNTRSWGTPRFSEYKDCGPLGSKSQVHMIKRSYLCAQVKQYPPATDPTAKLSPDWTEWLMGFPIGYTNLQ